MVSFLTIGIIWINHHAMISRLTSADHAILILNLLLLMSIGVLPFATELMATYLRQPDGQKLAAAVYSGALLRHVTRVLDAQPPPAAAQEPHAEHRRCRSSAGGRSSRARSAG